MNMLGQLLSLPGGKERNAPMEGLRGYAAGLIFLTHFCGTYLGQYFRVGCDGIRIWDLPTFPSKVAYWAFRSHYGVELFFVLSGFLVFRMIMAREGRFDYWHYISRRVARIYPAFLLALAACTLLLASIRSEVFSVSGFLKSFFLLDGILEFHVPKYNPVAWSLTYEFIFYLLCPLVLLLPMRSWKTRMLVAAAAVYLVLLWLPSVYLRGVLFFGGGFLAAQSDHRLQHLARRVPDALVLAFYLVTTMVYAATEGGRDWRIFIPLFFASSVLLVLNTCYGDGFLSNFFRLKWLRWFGNISYSFYLIHFVCVLVTFWCLCPLLWRFHSAKLDFVVLGGASFVLSFVAATVLFVLAEKPYFYAGDLRLPAWRRVQARLVLPGAAMAAVMAAVCMGMWVEHGRQLAGKPAAEIKHGAVALRLDRERGFQGITASPEVQVQTARGELRLQCRGNDAALLLPPLSKPSDKDLLVTVEVQSTADTESQLYYKLDKETAYSENNSRRARLHPGENRVTFRLPAKVQDRLRLDPVERPGQITIRSIEVCETERVVR
jgi:peptidoglycan/LPS O-acetylase OafA/YrhL